MSFILIFNDLLSLFLIYRYNKSVQGIMFCLTFFEGKHVFKLWHLLDKRAQLDLKLKIFSFYISVLGIFRVTSSALCKGQKHSNSS